jgi:hypothetical protein
VIKPISRLVKIMPRVLRHTSTRLTGREQRSQSRCTTLTRALRLYRSGCGPREDMYGTGICGRACTVWPDQPAHLDWAHWCGPHRYAARDAAGHEELRPGQHAEHDAPRLELTCSTESTPFDGGRSAPKGVICIGLSTPRTDAPPEQEQRRAGRRGMGLGAETPFSFSDNPACSAAPTQRQRHRTGSALARRLRLAHGVRELRHTSGRQIDAVPPRQNIKRGLSCAVT